MKQKIHESDHLLNKERLAQEIQSSMSKQENLNPKMNFEQDIIKQMFKGNYIKKALTNVEQAFLLWYVSILGDEWKIIADVLNYHPFTKGGIRDAEEMRIYFYNLND